MQAMSVETPQQRREENNGGPPVGIIAVVLIVVVVGVVLIMNGGAAQDPTNPNNSANGTGTNGTSDPGAPKTPDALLLLAAQGGSLKNATDALAAGANVDVTAPLDDKFWGGTALYVAADNGFVDIVKLLLKHNATVDAYATNNWTPLMGACYWGGSDEAKAAEIVAVLIANKANVSAITLTKAYSPLHFVAENGRATVAKHLIDAGARLDVQTATNLYTPLMLAAKNGRAAVAKLIVEAAAKTGTPFLEVIDANRETAFLHACHPLDPAKTKEDSERVIADLLTAGANALASSIGGLYCWHHVAAWSPATMTSLKTWTSSAGTVNSEVEVEVPGVNGAEPTKAMVKYINVKTPTGVRIFPEPGTPPMSGGQSATFIAARAANAQTVKDFFDSSVDYFDAAKTSLTMAACGGRDHPAERLEIVTWLANACKTASGAGCPALAAGREYDTANHLDKMTPLHFAAKNDLTDVVKFLLANGVVDDKRNSDGKRAYELATKPETIDAFSSAPTASPSPAPVAVASPSPASSASPSPSPSPAFVVVA